MLYVEFINKEGLFCVVFDCYIDCFVVKYEVQLFCEEKSVEFVLVDYFVVIVNCFISKDISVGCFMINNCIIFFLDLGDIVNMLKLCYVM